MKIIEVKDTTPRTAQYQFMLDLCKEAGTSLSLPVLGRDEAIAQAAYMAERMVRGQNAESVLHRLGLLQDSLTAANRAAKTLYGQHFLLNDDGYWFKDKAVETTMNQLSDYKHIEFAWSVVKGTKECLSKFIWMVEKLGHTDLGHHAGLGIPAKPFEDPGTVTLITAGLKKLGIIK